MPVDSRPRSAQNGSPEQREAARATSVLVHAEAHADERNVLLRALPPSSYAEFAARSRTVPLELRQVIQEPDTPVEYVYFPQTGMVSTVVVLSDGARVEAITVGRDGLVPFAVAVGGDQSPTQAFSQVNGVARQIALADFRELASRGSPLYDIVQRYAQATFMQAAQGVACNRLHSVEQRCARWLLSTHDRVDGDTFLLTHEFLAMMLGVRRAGVSVAAETLQKDGLIRYSRGRITIVDRQGLEHASCECYGAVLAEYERLLGSIVPDRELGSTSAMRDDTAAGKAASDHVTADIGTDDSSMNGHE